MPFGDGYHDEDFEADCERDAAEERAERRAAKREDLARRADPAGFATPADDDTVPREPGCRCHQEEGDSPCPVHGMNEVVAPAHPSCSSNCASRQGKECDCEDGW